MESRFTRDYIPLRKYNAKPVKLKMEARYKMVTLTITTRVIIDEDMLGKVPKLKYVDHDITYTTKFLKISPNK